MNNYLDLLATRNIMLPVRLEIEPSATDNKPALVVVINGVEFYHGLIDNLSVVETKISLLDHLCVNLTMSNKTYRSEQETAVIIRSFTVDGHELVGIYDCNDCISYQNDQNVDYRGFYLGFNGIWQFKLETPFYKWWHTVTGQGWLLEPAPIKQI